MLLRKYFSAFVRVYRTQGLYSAIYKVISKLRGLDKNTKAISMIFNPPKKDITSFYDFITYPDMGCLKGTVPSHLKSTINWLIPDFGIGSGGHLTIFRFIMMLEKNGFTNNICIVGKHSHANQVSARNMIREHFMPIHANVFFDLHDLPESEFTFATGWNTAYFLRYFNRTYHKLYFVQDFEPSFFSAGSEFAFAEETYKFGFTAICAGNWLADTLAKKYSMKTYSFSFSYDKEVYQVIPDSKDAVKRIFCYFRVPTSRRGLESALLALDIVGNKHPEVEFVFAGWDMSDYKFNHKWENAGLVTVEELASIYNRCDIGLIISFTNLSLLPLELMACGCAVVSNDGDNVTWLLNDENAAVTSPDPVKLAETICSLINDESQLELLKAKGMQFAKKTSWELEGDKVISYLEEISSSE